MDTLFSEFLKTLLCGKLYMNHSLYVVDLDGKI